MSFHSVPPTPFINWSRAQLSEESIQQVCHNLRVAGGGGWQDQSLASALRNFSWELHFQTGELQRGEQMWSPQPGVEWNSFHSFHSN